MDFGATIIVVLVTLGAAFLGLIEARRGLKRVAKKKTHVAKSESARAKRAV